MFHVILSLGWAVAFAIVCVMPEFRAASPEWMSAVLLFGLAQAVIWMSAKWTRAGIGLRVRAALAWRYPFLVATITLPLFTLGVLSIALGTASMPAADLLVVIELALMQFAAGLACLRAPRNAILGFRTRRTLSNDAEWFTANRRWGWWLAALAPFALLASLLPEHGRLAALLPSAIAGIAFLISDRMGER